MAEALSGAHRVMRSNYGTDGDPANRGERGFDQPAPTVTGKVDRNLWIYRTSTMPNATVRALDLPAPTIAFGNDANSAGWVYRSSNTANSAKRPLDAPAPTVMFGARSNKVEWIGEEDAPHPERSGARVTVAEAAALQTYPADFPWQGTKTDQYQQIGNAVPPLWAEAILAHALELG